MVVKNAKLASTVAGSQIDAEKATLDANSNIRSKSGYNGGLLPLGLPQPLSLEEKKFLLAVERGDIANVRRILQRAHYKHHININCMDPLGRRALTLAIDNENLEMVELLIIMGVETKDALLHAINAEFVEAVELLLEHEELIYTEGELYSWQKVEINTAMFAPDITPLILAAHKNNFEILKLLLDRGAAVPVPHDIRCGCEECVRQSTEDSLRYSLSRVNIYKALTSPSLICLTSTDPILTAFQLSWELRNLALTEQECKAEYMELRRQCQQFAVDLLDQTRTSHELAIILNYDPSTSTYLPGDRMTLARLVQAISFKQKKFVAHSNIQQLLAAIWYEGLPGFRRKTLLCKILTILQVALLFPLYCFIYMIAPNCSIGALMRKPFMKFLIHASSYSFFLVILIMVSQRADEDMIRIFGTDSMRRNLHESMKRQRGNGPTKLELVVFFYLIGFIWEEIQEIFNVGMRSYLRNMWNFIDFLRNALYISVVCLRTFAYIEQTTEIAKNPKMAYVPREQWDDFDPQLIAEGLFAAANIFSAVKMVHLFSINPHLGPLQISLGRMVIDIVKFFSIYTLVLFAFACGLNQLLWYFADLEKKKCYVLPPDSEADWESNGDSCMKWRRFGNLFEASQSLFWASFGMVGLDTFELTGIKSYTRFWGLLMFGSYCVINVIVLLNLLIAMMSNSYAMIDDQSDTEWKFARTKLWMSYFEDSSTLPPPFNVLPSAKWILRLFRKSSKEIARKLSKKRHVQEKENRYTSIIRALVWRYVSGQHRKFEIAPVTEDDINEVKCEISTMRYELLEIFNNNGMDVSSAAKKEKPSRAKRTKIWERRLMRDFHVTPMQTANGTNDENSNCEGDINEIKVVNGGESGVANVSRSQPPVREDPKARFRRIARLVASQSAASKWNFVLQSVAKNSQIGRCYNKESYSNLQQLQKAIQETKRLILTTPKTRSGRESPTIEFEDEKSSTLLELLNKISEELKENNTNMNATVKSKAALAAAPGAARNHRFLSSPSTMTTTTNPLPRDVFTVVKEHGFVSPTSVNKFQMSDRNSTSAMAQQSTSKSKTLPVIQLSKASKLAGTTSATASSIIAGATEMVLSATNLNQQLPPYSKQVKFQPTASKAIKKMPAPQYPSTPTQTQTPPPTAVDVMRQYQRPSPMATKPPMLEQIASCPFAFSTAAAAAAAARTSSSSSAHDTSPKAGSMQDSFDITFLDLSDSTEQLFAGDRPELSDASEISSVSTIRTIPRNNEVVDDGSCCSRDLPSNLRREVSRNGKSWI